eukprot:5991912-Pleurochrysis_carterae.AAC.4
MITVACVECACVMSKSSRHVVLVELVRASQTGTCRRGSTEVWALRTDAPLNNWLMQYKAKL